jgi:hypothetical protein
MDTPVSLFRPCLPRQSICAKAGPSLFVRGSLGVPLFLILSLSTVSAETLHTVDGREVAGDIVALTAGNAVMKTRAGRETVPAADIAAIRFGRAGDGVMSAMGRSVLMAPDGSAIAVREVSVSNGQLRAASDLVGSLAVPMERADCLLRPNRAESPRDLLREKERLNLVPRRTDVLVVRSQPGQYVAVDAVVDRMDTQQVVVIYDRAESAMPADTIAILIPAAPEKPVEPVKTLGQLVATDGSRLNFTAFGQLTATKAALTEIRFRGENEQPLSDLRPVAVKETPFFDDAFPWQKDRSVSGAPLQLDGKTYEKGLGLHADCRLTFDLGGKYRRLTALAGIDEQVLSGMAVLTVLADGKPLADRIALARDKPAVRLDLKLDGARELVVHVTFVEGTAGSGARVNLCEPLLCAISGR